MTKTKLGLGFELRRAAGVDADEFALTAFVFKFNEPLDQCEQGVVLTAADVIAGLPFRAALTCEDIAAEDVLAAELLKTEPFGL